MTTFKLGIICGGPSEERGISLNSARSVMDHLWFLEQEIFYVTKTYQYYLLKPSQLYSNTPDDFDFKLPTVGTALSEERLAALLQSCTIVFPLIHGEYGEDGVLQRQLLDFGVPFVGSTDLVCKAMFYKGQANQVLKENGYPVLPFCEDISESERFLQQHGKVVVKPQAGGSSIGVHVVDTLEDLKTAIAKTKLPIVEAYCEGAEFTVMVIEHQGSPVALLPTEIEIDAGIYDYQRKYLPTNNTRWYCPPRFSNALTQEIREQAASVFRLFKMQDFARLDGWVVDDQIIFSDLNPISGMEQNSFMFLQSSRLGFTHQSILAHILTTSCRRQGLLLPPSVPKQGNKSMLPILMGGGSEERQVSVMSGTNVWLKLRRSIHYAPKLYFLDKDHQVWPLPYTVALHHTTEETSYMLDHIRDLEQSLIDWQTIICPKLGVAIHALHDQPITPVPIETWVVKQDYVFLALHGGFGEDGRLQAILEQQNIGFNGSSSQVSALAMDKVLFGKQVNQLRIEGLSALPKQVIDQDTAFESITFPLPFIVKPQAGGCSVGVQVIQSKQAFLACQKTFDESEAYFCETYISTDRFWITSGKIKREKRLGWIELTNVLLETGGDYQALLPSMTVAKAEILSMAEKFQGGTGMNVTPPCMMSEASLSLLAKKLIQLAKGVQIKNYARVDLFYHLETTEIIIIEMNTLPALTPSTVLYHQALASGFANTPHEALEKLIQASL